MSENTVKAPRFRVGDVVRRTGGEIIGDPPGVAFIEWAVVSIISTRPNRYYYELVSKHSDSHRLSLQAEEDLL